MSLRAGSWRSGVRTNPLTWEGLYLHAAIVHDWLSWVGRSRDEADNLLWIDMTGTQSPNALRLRGHVVSAARLYWLLRVARIRPQSSTTATKSWPC